MGVQLLTAKFMPASKSALIVALLSLFALAFAFFMQYAMHLDPCHLCLLQRWPYALTACLGMAGMLVARRSRRAATIILGVSAAVFLSEAALAAYHAGVERHWWMSAFETCRATFSSATDILAQIEARPAARCDQIAWQFFGLSMADWNVFYALGATAFAAYAAIASGRRPADRR